MLMEFEEIEYTYACAQNPTINCLSLQIRQCKRYAIIGRNGCGKTTLFRLANGLYRPQKGTIRWQEKPLKYNHTALNQLRQQVGLVFQDPEQQLVGTTVEEDLSYGLCNLGLQPREISDRIQQTLTEFELTDLAHTPVNYLSLGQKKRLSIADVMILQPKLLLLDEPTAYLDPYQTRHLIKTLNHIQAKGTTVLIATHDLDFVYLWADWLFVMDNGQLQVEGTPENVFKQRQLMERLGLGIPLMLNLWQTWSNSYFAVNSPISDAQQFRQWIQQKWM
ncbi:energy-coupling factor ABC transporter ATP-binding protein [Crocosphaera sp.]|uniref:energy-coupling factor ABC transporter ATP-binding protein n=1 Tax=Crocosphaera sp. TaxID=2729996 RepID=UPI003F288F55